MREHVEDKLEHILTSVFPVTSSALEIYSKMAFTGMEALAGNSFLQKRVKRRRDWCKWNLQDQNNLRK